MSTTVSRCLVCHTLHPVGWSCPVLTAGEPVVQTMPPDHDHWHAYVESKISDGEVLVLFCTLCGHVTTNNLRG